MSEPFDPTQASAFLDPLGAGQKYHYRTKAQRFVSGTVVDESDWSTVVSPTTPSDYTLKLSAEITRQGKIKLVWPDSARRLWRVELMLTLR